jgi:ABC-type dipeptide/oligopeptide/nickel transport system permease subunit
MSVNYGSKRTVVGAHYGTRDFLAQRSTAVLMALYTVVLLVRFLTVGGPVGYEQWAGIFAPQWMKFLTLALFVALAGMPGSACVTSGWTTSSRGPAPCTASGHHCLAGRLHRLGIQVLWRL